MPNKNISGSLRSLKRISPIVIAFIVLVGVALAGEMLTRSSEAPTVDNANKSVLFDTGDKNQSPDGSAGGAEDRKDHDGRDDRDSAGEKPAPVGESDSDATNPRQAGPGGLANPDGSGQQSVAPAPAPQISVTDLDDDGDDWDDDGDDWDDDGDDWDDDGDDWDDDGDDD